MGKQRRPLLVEGRVNSVGRLMPVVDQVNLLPVVCGLSCEYACFFFCSGLCLPSASWAAALPVQLKCVSGGPLRLSPFFVLGVHLWCSFDGGNSGPCPAFPGVSEPCAIGKAPRSQCLRQCGLR